MLAQDYVRTGSDCMPAGRTCWPVAVAHCMFVGFRRFGSLEASKTDLEVAMLESGIDSGSDPGSSVHTSGPDLAGTKVRAQGAQNSLPEAIAPAP